MNTKRGKLSPHSCTGSLLSDLQGKTSLPQGEGPQAPSFGATGAHARGRCTAGPGAGSPYKAVAAMPCLGLGLQTLLPFSPQKLVFVAFYLQSNIMLLIKKEVKKKTNPQKHRK